MRITPLLLPRSFDELWFTGIAVIDIIGAILAFGAVAVTYSLFSGNFAVKVLDFLLLVGIVFVAGRTSVTCFQRRLSGETALVSRITAVGYGLFLVLAALYYIIQLFTSR
jgi:predicted transporter